MKYPMNMRRWTEEQLHELYRVYEFTDRGDYMPDKCTPIADFFNYVKTGLLTEEETRRALLQ